MTVGADRRVPGYLGRVLADSSDYGSGPEPVGTCFQIAEGLLVTSWHVLDDLAAGMIGAAVLVDALAGGVEPVGATVVRTDPLHDLAVLTCPTPLPACVAGLHVSDPIGLQTSVTVTGVVRVDDMYTYRFIDASGQWAGGTLRDDAVSLARLRTSDLLKGMSGAPVRMLTDDTVIGVVSGRYTSADGWLRDSVWVTRMEDLALLLSGLAHAPTVLTPKRGRTVEGAGFLRPPGAVGIGDADLRRLGVHPAISVPGVPDDAPPEYVPRDIDAAEKGVRALLVKAAERGGFVLLVGGSSVGKTRTAAEAVKALLPAWWLVHPSSGAEVAALAERAPGRMVVWLDELQRYLDGERGLTAGPVRALLNAAYPVVIVATLWPDRYASYVDLPAGEEDLKAREREVLQLADVVRIDSDFSKAERIRAKDAAARDPRLRAALRTTGYGLTQTLAAAPQLVGRWQDAKAASPYAWAVLTAALDAARLGLHSPMSADFLRAAAEDYIPGRQQTDAPSDWIDQALAYATADVLHGRVAALNPVAAGINQTAGYTAADYLVQYAAEHRRFERVPTSTWEAIVEYVTGARDASGLARRAYNRALYRYAAPLFERAGDAGDDWADYMLGKLLEKRRDINRLRALADARPRPRGSADNKLASLLFERGDADELRARADAGDREAVEWLSSLLVRNSDIDGAISLIQPGKSSGYTAASLADFLMERGDLERALRLLRAWEGVGDPNVSRKLAELLAERGDIGELRARAEAGDWDADQKLLGLLAARSDIDGLRARAETGNRQAVSRLVELLADRADIDGLRSWADAKDFEAGQKLVELLAARGDVDELRARADAGDWRADARLAEMLFGGGDVDGLRAWADAGNESAAGWLARLLFDLGEIDELRARADAGNQSAVSWLAEHLFNGGEISEAKRVLLDSAEAGDEYAAWHLAELLVKHGDIDEAADLLRAEVSPTDHTGLQVTRKFAELRLELDDIDGAAQLLRVCADLGDSEAIGHLAYLLVEDGHIDQAEQLLRERASAHCYGAVHAVSRLIDSGDTENAERLLKAAAEAGDLQATGRLVDLLTESGDAEGLWTLADADNLDAARKLAGLLAKRGDIDDLQTLIVSGYLDRGSVIEEDGVKQLAKTLTERGRAGEAKRLRRFGLTPDGSTATPAARPLLTDHLTRSMLRSNLVDVEAQLHAVDCQTCGRPIGNARPALCVDDMDAMCYASVHHPACRRPEWRDRDFAFSGGALVSYRVLAFLLPMELGDELVPWPCLLVNPSLEAIPLVRQGDQWRPGTVETFRRLGLLPAGPGLALNRPVPGAAARLNGGILTVQLSLGRWQCRVRGPISQRIQELDGILLGVTTSLVPDEISDAEVLMDALQGQAIAFGWAPLA
jgi:hypothetical protein